MEESIKDVDSQPQHSTGESLPTTPPQVAFTKVDNNLTGIGFFTASSKRSRKAIEKTTIVMDGGVEHRISILPTAKYGLPITQDQDYWLALMQLVEEHKHREGKITNPFTFTTAEVLKILGHRTHNGKNYKAVEEWLAVMAFTGIEGGAYNTVKKSWMTKRTHAVETTVTVGKELPDGRMADKNHIWFSQWQLDNINAGNLIAIELNTYTQLENNISKNLVPHLQEWLYASERDARFEKQYEDVCQLLGIRTYRYRSQIEEQLSPSLNELVAHGYLSQWNIEPMANRKNYKLVLRHGPKYHSDRKTRLERKQRTEILPAGEGAAPVHRPRQRRLSFKSAPEPPLQIPVIDYRLVAELTKRGIEETAARKVIADLPAGYDLMSTLEWADEQVNVQPAKFTNPPGFYISLLQARSIPPPTFESSSTRKARQEAEIAQRKAIQNRQEAVQREHEAVRLGVEAKIAAMSPEQRQALFNQAKQDVFNQPIMAGKPYSAIHDGAIRARMRELVITGWKFSDPESTQASVPEASQQTADGQPRFATQADLESLLATPLLPAPTKQAPAATQPEISQIIGDHLL